MYSASDYTTATEKGGEKLLILLFTVMLITNIIFKKSILRNNEKANYMMNVQAMALYIQTGALRLAIFSRLKSYFSIYMTVLFPYMLSTVKNKKNRLIYLTIILALFGSYGMILQGFPKYIIHTF